MQRIEHSFSMEAYMDTYPYTYSMKTYSQERIERAKTGIRSKACRGIMPNRAPLGYVNTAKKGRSNISLDYQIYRAIPYLFHSVAAGRSLKTTGVLAGLFGPKNRKGGVLMPSSV